MLAMYKPLPWLSVTCRLHVYNENVYIYKESVHHSAKESVHHSARWKPLPWPSVTLYAGKVYIERGSTSYSEVEAARNAGTRVSLGHRDGEPQSRGRVSNTQPREGLLAP